LVLLCVDVDNPHVLIHKHAVILVITVEHSGGGKRRRGGGWRRRGQWSIQPLFHVSVLLSHARQVFHPVMTSQDVGCND
jgi:hypothetical protein